MGELMRRYWLPALLSEEIPVADCPPVKVRLLGEDLVAFRDSQGRIGLLAEHCSHRGTSLFYGRNEECGLRCIYHGWKYDVDGNVVETPAEPREGNLKNKLRHTAYPCREAAGVIFAYMGPKQKMPLFPNYEWLISPPGYASITARFFNECNYLQALEGDCDTARLAVFAQVPPKCIQFEAPLDIGETPERISLPPAVFFWRRSALTGRASVNRCRTKRRFLVN